MFFLYLPVSASRVTLEIRLSAVAVACVRSLALTAATGRSHDHNAHRDYNRTSTSTAANLLQNTLATFISLDSCSADVVITIRWLISVSVCLSRLYGELPVWKDFQPLSAQCQKPVPTVVHPLMVRLSTVLGVCKKTACTNAGALVHLCCRYMMDHTHCVIMLCLVLTLL